jgi:hypothetical protein
MQGSLVGGTSVVSKAVTFKQPSHLPQSTNRFPSPSLRIGFVTTNREGSLPLLTTHAQYELAVRAHASSVTPRHTATAAGGAGRGETTVSAHTHLEVGEDGEVERRAEEQHGQRHYLGERGRRHVRRDLLRPADCSGEYSPTPSFRSALQRHGLAACTTPRMLDLRTHARRVRARPTRISSCSPEMELAVKSEGAPERPSASE